MDRVKDELTTHICRLCLTESSEHMDIFKNSEKLSLTLRIMACASLEVQSSDMMPKQICTKCRIQLEESYLFRKRCQIADKKLKRNIRLMNAGKPTEGFEFDEDDTEEFQESLDFLSKIKQQQEDENIKELERKNKETIAGLQKDMIAQNELKISKVQEKYQKVIQELSNERDKYLNLSLSSTKMIEASSQTDTLMDDFIEGDGNGEVEILPYEMVSRNESNISESERNEELSLSVDEDEYFFEEDAQSNCSETKVILYENSGDEKFSEVQENEPPNATETYEISLLGDGDIEEVNEEYLEEIEWPEDKDFSAPESSDEHVVLSFLPTKRKRKLTETETSSPPKKSNKEPELKVFQCSMCSESFSRRIQLITHEFQHTAKREGGHTCDICHRTFPNYSSLQRHVRVHTGEKPFKCTTCKKAFTQKEILARHIITHTNKRPYPCDKCDKSFLQPSARNIHIRHVHLNQLEAQKCPLCPKSFAHASGLSRHLLIHSGCTFSCKMCDRSFSDKSALRRHELTQHKNKHATIDV